MHDVYDTSLQQSNRDPIDDPIIQILVGKKFPIYRTKWLNLGSATSKDFSLQDNLAAKRGWNWAAFFCGISWMYYRRMYAYAFIFFTIQSIFSLILVILQPKVPGWIIVLMASWVCGSLGDGLYYNYIRDKRSKIMKNFSSDNERIKRARRHGGPSFIMAILITLLYFMVMIVLSSAFNLEP